MPVSKEFIEKLRSLRQDILDSGCTDIKMSVYRIPVFHNCQGARLLDKGYYYSQNGEVHSCNDGQEDADFRALECEICHQEILLLNTGMPKWDFIPNIVSTNDLGHSAYKK